ncbi:hypothetical protein LSAT2_000339 [Lamellibrachia satsuma]|nr:hypothetical protein LSAT2_000339 [Lamellibrachia satsuma]
MIPRCIAFIHGRRKAITNMKASRTPVSSVVCSCLWTINNELPHTVGFDLAHIDSLAVRRDSDVVGGNEALKPAA